MSGRILVVAPHPDDEVLGCGGTLLRRKAEGAELAWLIVTGMSADAGWPSERIEAREQEIAAVAAMMGFSHVANLRLPAARLDGYPMADLVAQFAKVFEEFQPDEVMVPHRSDVHTDHRIAFDAAVACTKPFRYPFVRRVVAYETLSETDAALDPDQHFRPNWFVDITAYLEKKLTAAAIYRSEMAPFPFPRSGEALRALAAVRGAASGFRAAEAFQLLRERQ